MIKNILAIILGLIIGNIAIMSLHYLGLYFYPLPEGADMSDMTAIAEYVKIAQLRAFETQEIGRLGDSQGKYIVWEGGLQVDNELAHGLVADCGG